MRQVWDTCCFDTLSRELLGNVLDRPFFERHGALLRLVLTLIVVTLTFALHDGRAHAQGTFNFETATDNGNTVSETIGSVEVTVGASVSAGDVNVDRLDTGNAQNFSGFALRVDGSSETWTVSFDQAVDVTSIKVLESLLGDVRFVFTPIGGTNSVVTFDFFGVGSPPDGQTATLNFEDVTGFTIRFQDANNPGLDFPLATIVFDEIITTAAGPAEPEVSLSSTTTSILEAGGQVTLTATADSAVSGDLTVPITFTGTASGSDYSGAGDITITDGSTTGTVTLTATQDTTDDDNETIIATINSATIVGATVGSPDAQTITIIDDDPAPVLDIDDVILGEGDAGNATFDFTVTLDRASSSTVTVSYATTSAGGTAVAGTDYTAIGSTQLTFDPGETSKTVSVSVAGDEVVERDETFSVTLSSPSNASIGDGTGAGTITNDDAAIVTIADVAVDESSGTATITLALDNAVDGGFGVDASTSDGSATTADGDYTAVTNATETFAGTASETQTFTVTLGGDTKVEADETVNIAMSNLVPVTVDAGDIDITDGATLTLTNDDQASVIIADVSGNEDDGAITVTVTLDTAVDGGFDVDVSTTDGAATTADNDYTAVVNQTLTFAGAAGETETFTVTPTSDGTLEGNETVEINMSGLSTNNGVDAGDIDITDGATVTILNDDSISGSVNDPSVAEGDSGSTTLTYTVTLSDPAPAGGASFSYATTDGTASDGTDYTGVTGTVSIAVGQTTGTIDVTVSGDSVVERDETITLTLSNPTGTDVVIDDATGTGTITNDDAATVTIGDVALDENSGTATITLTLDATVDGGFAVDVSTADGTATTADSDYTAVTSQTETFAGTASETETLTVSLGGDTKVEADETLTLSMSNLVPITVDASDITITDTGTLTLNNDDAATVTIADVAVSEDAGTATIMLTLDNEVDGGFDVDVSTSDGTATTADSDYVAVTNATETFAGSASETETLSVTIGVDAKPEDNETVGIAMSNLVPVTVDPSDITITDTATLTINNDDGPPTLTVADISVNEGDGNAVLTAQLNTVSVQTISFSWSTSDGSAVAPGDYMAQASQSASITPGNTSVQLSVPLNDDSLEEAAETFTVVLSSVTNATAPAGPATVTIGANDLVAPTLLSFERRTPTSENTNADQLEFTATFSEDVTGVDTGDFAANGTTASVSSVSAASASVYAVTLSGGDLAGLDGVVGLDVAGSVSIADLVGNAVPSSEPATDQTYTVDNEAPSTALSAGPGPFRGDFTVTLTFGQAMSGVALGDIVVGSGTASNLQTSDNTVFTFTVTPTADGTVTVDFPASGATDLAGNDNVAATQLSRGSDITSPDVTITAPGLSVSSVNAPFQVQITFTEPVTGFAVGDIVVGNAAASALATADNLNFTATITPSGPGDVTVDVAAGVAQDAVGNDNAAATTFSVTNDTTAPVVTLSGPGAVFVNTFALSISATEDITGLAEGDFVVTGGSVVAASLSGSGDSYTVQIEPVLGQTVDVNLPAGAVQDIAGNPTTAASAYSVQAGSPESEFEANREAIIEIVQEDATRRLTNEMSANAEMIERGLERFIDSFQNPDTATRDIPFDVTGRVGGTYGERLSTNGTVFGQRNLDRGALRTAMGQFDVAVDEDNSWAAQISGRLTYEFSITDDTRLGYFFGGSLSRGEIAGAFNGDTRSISGIVGGYGLTRLQENLFASGYVGVGYARTDLSFSNTTLALSGDYGAFSYYGGASLTGSIANPSGVEFRPQLAFDYGQTDIGVVGLQASAFGLTSPVSTDYGAVSILDMTVATEVIFPIDMQAGFASLSFEPQLICRRTTGSVDEESCGGGLGLGLEGETENGNTRYGIEVDVTEVGGIRQSAARLFFEAEF